MGVFLFAEALIISLYQKLHVFEWQFFANSNFYFIFAT